MARIEVKAYRYLDDLTDEEVQEDDLECIVFAVDGDVFEIDLNHPNAAAFRMALQPYKERARKTTKAALLRTLPRVRRRPSASSPSNRTDSHGPSSSPLPRVEPQNTPISREGVESEPLSEPDPPPVPPEGSKPSDFQELAGSEPPIPSPWNRYAPSPTDTDKDLLEKCKLWAEAANHPTKKITRDVFTSWEGFYEQKVYRKLVPS